MMACRLTGAEPLSEPMLERKFIYIHSRKCIWKCRQENGAHLVSMCQQGGSRIVQRVTGHTHAHMNEIYINVTILQNTPLNAHRYHNVFSVLEPCALVEHHVCMYETISRCLNELWSHILLLLQSYRHPNIYLCAKNVSWVIGHDYIWVDQKYLFHQFFNFAVKDKFTDQLGINVHIIFITMCAISLSDFKPQESITSISPQNNILHFGNLPFTYDRFSMIHDNAIEMF